VLLNRHVIQVINSLFIRDLLYNTKQHLAVIF